MNLLDPAYLGLTCSGPTAAQDCDPCGKIKTCVGGRCVDRHAMGVSSLVLQMAPGAEVYCANTPKAHSLDPSQLNAVGCNPAGILSAYDQFVDLGVDFVVESYGCKANVTSNSLRGPDESIGVVQDWFADRLLLFKAAGNGPSATEACAHTINGLCVGSHNLSDQVSCFSSTKNPTFESGEWGYFSDREEPDLLALGGSSQYGASCAGAPVEHWLVAGPLFADLPFDGTSAAAPVAAGLAALWLGECQGVGTFVGTSTWVRNRMMAAARINADGWRYSTSTLSTDHRDGAGIFAYIPNEGCNAGPPDDTEDPGGGGSTTITLDDPETSGRPVDGPGSPFPPTPVEPGPEPPGAQGQNQTLLPSATTSGYRYLPLLRFAIGADGGSVRSVISWNGCAQFLGSGMDQRKPGIDYDLFLLREDTAAPSYVYMSRSYDDVNEGFDVDLEAGEYGVYVVWPDQPSLCGEVPFNLETTTWCYNCDGL